ncbi:hypothetical protein BCR43DRAFT_492090 [Syncephalastrum racemosum]|uniref:DUF3074 domain-containing protein n=1 Tax=Syncephalastrum racemosum TaxID=13706 RepID=A0A1X2HD44_SYNRA|nr:hypothetical protein BCR43DRAFT_492090 [Syncephalastrum racemosum]
MLETIEESQLRDASPEDLKTRYAELFAEVQERITESMEWPIVYQNGVVTTRRRRRNSQDRGCAYLQRSSVHHDVNYDALRSVLFKDHSMNEPKYVELMQEAKLLFPLAQTSSGEAGVYRLAFKATLASGREFVELVATQEQEQDNGKRSFMIVSKPVQSSIRVHPGYVRGQYESWEFVRELEDGGIEWIAVQHSDAGGWLPKWLVNWFNAREFHKDVKAIIRYVNQ